MEAPPPWNGGPPGDDGSVDVFLQPGGIWFGRAPAFIRTLLGSCVAITVWHPRLRLGGMCHYLLPAAPLGSRTNSSAPTAADSRYANGAVDWLIDQLTASGTHPKEYEVKMFGGGAQFIGSRSGLGIGASIPDGNVNAGRKLLATHGFHLSAEHLGGCGHRTVIFDVSTGSAWVRHVDRLLPEES